MQLPLPSSAPGQNGLSIHYRAFKAASGNWWLWRQQLLGDFCRASGGEEAVMDPYWIS